MSRRAGRTVRVGCVYTDTPLARAHARALYTRTPRKIRPIPWRKFDRSKYPEPALALMIDAMRGLAFGEYGAVDNFARVSSALSLAGAPLDLVAAATRIAPDEVRHAEYALRMASLCAGKDVAFEFDEKAMNLPWRKAIKLTDLDCLMLHLPTISETLAAALLTACRDRSTDPVAHAMFASIVGDEVHHLRLGWYYFAWRAPQWTQAERQAVSDFAGDMIVQIERQFWKGRDAPAGSKKAAKALGVLDSKTQRQVIRRVMENEIVPGLDALGLGASAAWRVRHRGNA